jgi:hypothetical protein
LNRVQLQLSTMLLVWLGATLFMHAGTGLREASCSGHAGLFNWATSS